MLATGSAIDADFVEDRDTELAVRMTRGASGLVRTAEELEKAAGLWRSGRLD